MVSREEIRRLAFVEHGPSSLQLASEGPLAGLTFAAKDLIDICGFKSAWGNPDRLRDAEPAVATAPGALAPLMAGARLIGKTHTDELACGMFGMNPHFGIPINPKAPDRVPGGRGFHRYAQGLRAHDRDRNDALNLRWVGARRGLFRF